jgi:hypothetical protein
MSLLPEQRLMVAILKSALDDIADPTLYARALDPYGRGTIGSAARIRALALEWIDPALGTDAPITVETVCEWCDIPHDKIRNIVAQIEMKKVDPDAQETLFFD